MAAPATAATVTYRAQHALIVDAASDAPLPEELRKQATWDAHRTARGRRREE
jgi:hypothetical protein